MTSSRVIVYLDNVIFHRLQRRLSDRNYGCRLRPKYLIFSQFSIYCYQNALPPGLCPGPRWGTPQTPAGIWLLAVTVDVARQPEDE